MLRLISNILEKLVNLLAPKVKNLQEKTQEKKDKFSEFPKSNIFDIWNSESFLEVNLLFSIYKQPLKASV